MTSESLSFRPYARLLTMLGEQLIKNERIALVELIKNAYDADADTVEIRFEDFNEDMTHNDDSRIIVRDDGTGMTLDTLRKEWMNPATPVKHHAKKKGRGTTPVKKRVLQGEKGIGRFAVLKLGKRITIASRRLGIDREAVLTWDFSRFDDDFVLENDDLKELFLDQIRVDLSTTEPNRLASVPHGTAIEVTDLKGRWGLNMVEHVRRDVVALTDPVSRITRHESPHPLKIVLYYNGKRQVTVEEGTADQLRGLIENKAVLKIRGKFDSQRSEFVIDSENPIDREISLADPKITGLSVWRDRIRASSRIPSNQLPLSGLDREPPEFVCGDFEFHFFIFDFTRGIDGRHALKPADRRLLKEHRIYLYRDGVRVYPYGDPDDDWLNIDTMRGTGRAGNFLSNDQTIGWIDITHEHNPDLRDKTSREGLIESGGAAPDLIFLVQVLLSYVKQYPFARHQHRQRKRSTARLVHDEAVATALATLRNRLTDAGQRTRAQEVAKVEADYKRERQHLVQRAEITEDLAGVGLSVEMASHDIMLLLNRGHEIARELAREARSAGDDQIADLADRLIGVLHQVVQGMGDVQTLFRSSRRRRKHLRIAPILDKVHQIYRPLLDGRNIRYEKTTKGKSPLVASTTDAVVMQVLINLFDNAAYWLESTDAEARQVSVTVDGDGGCLIFSDSGPGVDPEDVPFIFDAFYSGKGQDGRGLGLYIARQLLERHDYRIAMADAPDRVLPGANFVVSFTKEET